MRDLTTISPTIRCLVPVSNANVALHRWKSKKHRAESTESESDEHTPEEEIVDKNTKFLNAHVNSMRMDAVLKAGLGIARTKIDTLFYESKIRVNGQRILKKSAQLNVGDEIDVVRRVSEDNPNFLIVARVEVVNVEGRGGEKLRVRLKRCKSLLIENYDDKWKSTGS